MNNEIKSLTHYLAEMDMSPEQVARLKAIVGHFWGTPVQTLMIAVGHLQEGFGEPEERLSTVHRQVERLRTMIYDVRNFCPEGEGRVN